MVERTEGDVMAGFQSVPVELRALPQWVARRGKVLVDPKTGRNAKTNDPATWGSFDAAVAHAEGNGLDGIGLVFTESDPFAFVDLDGVLDPETGELAPEAARIVDELDSYTEISSSGRGLHVVVRGEKPGPRCKDRERGVEMYDRRQYLAVSGRPLPGRPATVEDRGGVLAALYRATFGDAQEDGHDGELPEPVSPPMDDDEVIRRCRRARNGEKFAALYDDGELLEYGGDHSSADLALVGRLAFYTQDPEQIDRLFRKSALMRPKWDEKRGAKTYGERTVHMALVGRSEFYGAEQGFPDVVMVDDVGEGKGHVVPGGVPDLPSHTVRDGTGGDGPRARARRGVFPVEVLPPVLKRMTEEVSREMNVPPEYFVAPALATLAVAIGGTRYLNVFGSWSVLGNLSAATVAESADKKTPPYKMAIAPAMKLQKEHFREYKLGKEEYEEKYRRWEMEKKNTPKGELPPPPPEEPKLQNVVAHDFTSEALADVLNDTPRGVLITDDELSGFFNGLDQYKSGGRGNERQRHLKIMSNVSFTIRRRGGDPVLVEDPVASYTGNIQPDVLPAMLIPKPGGRKGDADDGMLHRWLFAFPPPVDTVDSLEESRAVTPAAELQYDFLYKKLRDLDFDENGEPRRVEFTPNAFKKFNDEVYEEWQRRKNRPGLPRLLRSSYGKMADHTARIALVLALCRDPGANTGQIVGADDVEGAAAIAEYFAVQMRKVQAALRREKEGKDERYLRVLNALLDEHGDRWRVASAELHALLRDGGVYDIPDRTTEMTTELSELSDRTVGITIETGKRVGEENARGVEIVRDAPAPASSRPEGMSRTVQDGSQDAPQDTGGSPAQGLNTEELILFALDRLGRAYPKDLAEVTERKPKTVQNALTRLNGAGKVEYTGNENEDGAKEVRLKSPIAVDDGPKDFFDPTRGYK